MNKKITIKLSQTSSRNYNILIGSNLQNELLKFLRVQKNIRNIVIITDSTVEKLYGEKMVTNLESSLPKAKTILNLFSFPAGEKHKTQSTVSRLQDHMFAQKCGRDTLVIALGGGVVGDVAGYVSATYMRGIPFVQAPTTLLAMVDSSVGGKTGVDTKYGKNMVGAFWQPLAVFADVEMLKTLPKEHIRSGLPEAVKMFVTHDKKMFEYVISNREKILQLDLDVIQKIISRAVELKAGVVIRDETEKNERKVLNFGHTVGHALEKLSNYKLLHGYAVGLGMIVEARISNLLGKLSDTEYELIEKTIVDLGVKTGDIKKFEPKKIISEMSHDKKMQNGEVQMVLLNGIEKVCKKHGKWAHFVESKVIFEALE
jgi:3-dehydroquinate synthase